MAWPVICSPPGSGPAMVAASAPVTDRRAGPVGTGRGPQQDAGCPKRLSPAPLTQAPTHACPDPARPSTFRHRTTELRENSFRVFGPVLVPAHAPPNRRRNGVPLGAPARSKDPPLCTLGNVVFRWAGRRLLRREAQSTWFGIRWCPNLFPGYGRRPFGSVKLPRSATPVKT